MQFKFLTSLLSITFLLVSPTVIAGTLGTESGGGGDASEARVNEVRADILSWIERDGGKELILPSGLSYDDYKTKMIEILQPQKVVIGFVEKDDETNEELMVVVNGMPKTCRGFISKISLRPHILCNVARFASISESAQYQLIHHEYAGLANVENNDGAASDYSISSQLTDFLVPQVVLRLAVKRNEKNPELRSSMTCLKNGRLTQTGQREVILVERKVRVSTGITDSIKVFDTFDSFDACAEVLDLGNFQEADSMTADEVLVTGKNCFSSAGEGNSAHYLVNEKRDPETGLVIKIDILGEFSSLKYCKENLQ